MNESPVQPGDVLVGKYRVDKVLGMGNMGIVVAATHITLGLRVALKFMLAGKGLQEERHARFLREARASVALRTQHVARVVDVGMLDNGAPYMAMEFLDGRDLDAVLREQGSLPVAEAVGYVLQACEGVAEAHAAGIVHRDIKPANLFLTRGAGGVPCIKVLDFGISKFSGEELKLTQEEAALGSPLYMSPEHLRSSRDVDQRADVWALGITLYELVAGKTPFHADRIQELCARVFFGEPTPLSTYCAHIPGGFEGVVMRCLEKERDRRFANVAELAAALAPYAPRQAGPAETVASVLGLDLQPSRPTDLLPGDVRLARSNGVAGSVSSPVALGPRTAPPRKGRAAVAMGVAAALAGLVGVGIFVWARSSASEMHPAASAAASTASAAETGTTTAAPTALDPLPERIAAVATVTPSAAPSAKPTATAVAPRTKPAVPRPAPAPPELLVPPKPPAAKPPSTTYTL